MLKFIDDRHKETFEKMIQSYGVNRRSRDHVLLMYLLSSIVDENLVKELVDGYGELLTVKPSAILNGWVTHGDEKIIRLAFHLYNWGAPTISLYEDEDKLDELAEYLPMNCLLGLDYRLTRVALEALKMLCYWDSYYYNEQ